VWPAFESTNSEDVPLTGLMFMVNARSDRRNGKTTLYLTWGRKEYSLCPAVCVKSTSLPHFFF